jgi:hypothetical protein
MEIVLKAGGYNIIGSITIDGAASKNKVPFEIQEQAKMFGMNL